VGGCAHCCREECRHAVAGDETCKHKSPRISDEQSKGEDYRCGGHSDAYHAKFAKTINETIARESTDC
jgi:hypothetical protein